jgi:hypothetical protein
MPVVSCLMPSVKTRVRAGRTRDVLAWVAVGISFCVGLSIALRKAAALM